MTIPSPYSLIDPFLLKSMACNASDGSDSAMAGRNELAQALHQAKLSFQIAHPTGSAQQFLDHLGRACLGQRDLPLAPERPEPPPFTELVDERLDVDEISTVVTLPTFLKVISLQDKIRFETDHDVRFTSTGSSTGADLTDRLEEKLVARLRGIPASERSFRISSAESHGRPFLWFTARSDLAEALDDASRKGLNPADIARDRLGLIHHGPRSYGSDRPNHLIALHFPGAIAERAGHMRPSVIQACVNRRFVLKFDDAPTSGDEWGNALDLWLYSTSAGAKPIGGRERVFLRLQASLFREREKIHFDYLGKVQLERGTIPHRDDDEAFLNLLGRGRDLDALLRGICE